MGNLFAELKRRHIYRVAAAYAVVAWVLVQLVNNITPMLNLPNSVGTVVLVLLAVGFPVVLLFAWVQHLASDDGAAARATTGTLDWMLIGALAVVIALVSYQQLAPSRSVGAAEQQANVAPATRTAAAPTQPGGISVAVLPFANLSGDAGQEFFSDGMTEEITTALTKVSALRVVGRESAFQFKGQKTDVRAVGQVLGALYLIEGTVRKAGDRVRISAQLTRADSGVNLWAENYDRELKDIFATQEDVAQAIVGALKVPLGLKQGERLVSDRTNDPETYDQYLRARALYRARAIGDAIPALEKIVAHDPGFAPAWATLSLAYARSPRSDGTTRGAAGPVQESRRLIEASLNQAEMAAHRAIELDPKNATGYGALAGVTYDRGHWAEAEDLFRQALALDANDPEVLDTYVSMLSAGGRLKASLSVRERLRNLEPLVPAYVIRYAAGMVGTGQGTAALSLLEALPADPNISYDRNTALARAYADAGRYTEAADTLLAIKGNQVTRKSIEDAARVLRQAPIKTNASKDLPVFEGALAFVNFYAGAPERILDQPEYRFDIGIRNFDQSVWEPKYASVRKSQRFKTFARKAGLVDYWRARGWPDLCRPMGADDFVCD